MNVLLDERSDPAPRAVIASLLAAATSASIAVAHVRLAAIDLGEEELGGLRSCRVLLGRLDHHGLSALAESGRQRPGALSALARFIQAPHVEIRSAGLGAWLPDFSIYDGVRLGSRGVGSVCLMGAHWFHTPPVATGPSYTCMLTGSDTVERARRRFEELWAAGYDVRDAVLDVLAGGGGMGPRGHGAGGLGDE
jgi:hypothetical protein